MLAWKTSVGETVGELVVARINSTVLSAKKRSTIIDNRCTITLNVKDRHDHVMMHDMSIMMQCTYSI